MFVLKSVGMDIEYRSSSRPVFASGVWECSDNRVTDPAGDGFEVVEAQPEQSRQITVLAFRKRFTRGEKAAMEFAASTAAPVFLSMPIIS